MSTSEYIVVNYRYRNIDDNLYQAYKELYERNSGSGNNLIFTKKDSNNLANILLAIDDNLEIFDKTKEVSDFQKNNPNFKLVDKINNVDNFMLKREDAEESHPMDYINKYQDKDELFIHGYKILLQNGKYYLYMICFFCKKPDSYDDSKNFEFIHKEILERLKNVKSYDSEKIIEKKKIYGVLYDLTEFSLDQRYSSISDIYENELKKKLDFYWDMNVSPMKTKAKTVVKGIANNLGLLGGKSKKHKKKSKKHKKKTQKRKH